MRSSIACARCRRSKVKCINNGVNTTCRACETSGRECTYPPPATGGSGGVAKRESMLPGQPTTDGPPHGEVSHTRPFKYTCPTRICFEETGIVADFTKAFHQIWPFHACSSPRGSTFDIHALVVHTSASLLENNKFVQFHQAVFICSRLVHLLTRIDTSAPSSKENHSPYVKPYIISQGKPTAAGRCFRSYTIDSEDLD